MRGTKRAIAAATLTLLAACSSGGLPASETSTPSSSTVASSTPPSPGPAPASSPATTRARPTSIAPRSTERVGPPPTSVATTHPPASSAHSSAPTASALPLHLSTGDAQQVITVVAASHSSTSARLQAWQRSSAQWKQVGPELTAWLGTGGIGTTSEQQTTTPQGSFTLTEAFGREPDPGTALPYRQTTPADWWISQSGPLYNTEQHCSSNCPFAQGDPNEHLYYAIPYYEYAVVIDYNRRPVVQGAGSAFFLHVTVGQPTQGCVSIERDQLVRILRWLKPSEHPRILMGVG